MTRILCIVSWLALTGCASVQPCPEPERVMSMEEAQFYQVPVCEGMTWQRCWGSADDYGLEGK
jgi:hypothetical protein